jgi:hypothetical protein
MKKIIIIQFLLMAFIMAHSQDENYFKFANRFEKTDTIVLVKSQIESSEKEKYNDLITAYQKNRNKVRFVVKEENQLNSTDLEKHLLFFGIAKNFKMLNGYSPEALKKTPKGFDFGSYIFNDSLDVIYLFSSDTTKLFHIGNSLTALESIWGTYSALFQYNIMQNFANTHYGTLENDRFVKNLDVDMVNERINYMYHIETKYFNLYYSKRYDKEYINSNTISEIDSRVSDIISTLELKEPNRKIDCFLFFDKNEKLRLSHTFGDGNAVIKAWQNYCTDLSSLGHESVHLLFDNQIVTKDHWAFLSEGIEEYYGSTFDGNWDRLKSNIKNRENIPINEYLTDKTKFWNRSDLSYPLSGHFCRFLIEKYGLDSFKKLFVLGLENGFEKVYGIGKTEMINNWKEFIKNN